MPVARSVQLDSAGGWAAAASSGCGRGCASMGGERPSMVGASVASSETGLRAWWSFYLHPGRRVPELQHKSMQRLWLSSCRACSVLCVSRHARLASLPPLRLIRPQVPVRSRSQWLAERAPALQELDACLAEVRGRALCCCTLLGVRLRGWAGCRWRCRVAPGGCA